MGRRCVRRLASPSSENSNLPRPSVYQMSVLEMESTGQGTPQGVVLALVGPVLDESSKEQEGIRTLRMYNLASLVSLAKWAIAQKVSSPVTLTGW